jgi:hypothetical protein
LLTGVSETEAAIERLMDHLDRWLLQQPEWLYLMGLPDRATRRRLATLIARELTTIPVDVASPVLGRQMRRKLLAEFRKGTR